MDGRPQAPEPSEGGSAGDDPGWAAPRLGAGPLRPPGVDAASPAFHERPPPGPGCDPGPWRWEQLVPAPGSQARPDSAPGRTSRGLSSEPGPPPGLGAGRGSLDPAPPQFMIKARVPARLWGSPPSLSPDAACPTSEALQSRPAWGPGAEACGWHVSPLAPGPYQTLPEEETGSQAVPCPAGSPGRDRGRRLLPVPCPPPRWAGPRPGLASSEGPQPLLLGALRRRAPGVREQP